MRNCLRCNSSMVDKFEIKVDGGKNGITVMKMNKLKDIFFGGTKPKVDVCPKCGEISMYLEDPSVINKK